MTFLTCARETADPLTNPNNYLESVFIAKSQSVTGKTLFLECKRKKAVRNVDILRYSRQV